MHALHSTYFTHTHERARIPSRTRLWCCELTYILHSRRVLDIIQWYCVLQGPKVDNYSLFSLVSCTLIINDNNS